MADSSLNPTRYTWSTERTGDEQSFFFYSILASCISDCAVTAEQTLSKPCLWLSSPRLQSTQKEEFGCGRDSAAQLRRRRGASLESQGPLTAKCPSYSLSLRLCRCRTFLAVSEGKSREGKEGNPVKKTARNALCEGYSSTLSWWLVLWCVDPVKIKKAGNVY